METRKIIDLIDSREVEIVGEWLKKFENIKFFNRDGSQSYAKAIFQSHPNAVQISDYFHLVKNLCDYLKDYLFRKLPKLIEIDGFFCDGKILIDEKLTKTKDKYSTEWELAQIIKKMYNDGNSYHSIGKSLNLQQREIKKYLESTKKQFEKSKSAKEQNILEKQSKKNY